MGADLAVVAVLVVVNACLAGTEMALVSLRETQVDQLERESRAGATLARLARNPSRFLATIQVGITLAGFGASASAAVNLAEPVAEALEPTLGTAAATLSVGLVTIVLAFVTLVAGELAPKRIAMQAAQPWALAAARPLSWLQTATAPAVWLLERSANGLVRLFGFDPTAEPDEISPDELRVLVSDNEEMDDFHRDVLTGAFEVADRRVGDVITARRRVFLLDAAQPVAEARAALAATGFSRAPVCGPTGLDDVLGVVHLRDLLDVSGDPDDTALDRARDVPVLPESIGVLDALRQLQDGRGQLAVVVDERGGGEGIVTVEDLVEELVGEIFDESDRDHARVVREGDVLLVPGGFPAHDLEDIGVEVPDGRYATVAGFVIERLGQVPREPGGTVVHAGRRFEVTGVEGRRIAEVRISPVDDEG